MAVKQTGQMSFVEAFIGRAQLGGSLPVLDRIGSLVEWHRFEALLAGLRHDGPGHPGWPALVLFKALLLQSLYGLSVRELEEALADCLSFRRFCVLGLEDKVPGHTALNRFHTELVGRNLLEKLFAELDRQLDKAGVMVKRGTMLDATLIEAAAAPGSAERVSRDRDAAFGGARKKGGFTFGYKAHVGVDEGSGLIRAVITTPANVNDTVPADGLVRGDESAVWADGAYHTHARAAALKAVGVKARLARRPNKHHPALPPRLKRYNQLIARRRAAVETTFATLKNRMRLTRIRYLGLTKAHAQVMLAAIQSQALGGDHAIVASETGPVHQIRSQNPTNNPNEPEPRSSFHPKSPAGQIARQAPLREMTMADRRVLWDHEEIREWAAASSPHGQPSRCRCFAGNWCATSASYCVRPSGLSGSRQTRAAPECGRLRFCRMGRVVQAVWSFLPWSSYPTSQAFATTPMNS
jgi:IS5 family transposase